MLVRRVIGSFDHALITLQMVLTLRNLCPEWSECMRATCVCLDYFPCPRYLTKEAFNLLNQLKGPNNPTTFTCVYACTWQLYVCMTVYACVCVCVCARARVWVCTTLSRCVYACFLACVDTHAYMRDCFAYAYFSEFFALKGKSPAVLPGSQTKHSRSRTYAEDCSSSTTKPASGHQEKLFQPSQALILTV